MTVYKSIYEHPKKAGFYECTCQAGHRHIVKFYQNKFGTWVWNTGEIKCGWPLNGWRENELKILKEADKRKRYGKEGEEK